MTRSDEWAGCYHFVTHKSVLSTILTSSCVLLPSDSLKLLCSTPIFSVVISYLSTWNEFLIDQPLPVKNIPPTLPSCLSDLSEPFLAKAILQYFSLGLSNMILFRINRQQTWHGFCWDVRHFQFSCYNFIAWAYIDTQHITVQTLSI